MTHDPTCRGGPETVDETYLRAPDRTVYVRRRCWACGATETEPTDLKENPNA